MKRRLNNGTLEDMEGLLAHVRRYLGKENIAAAFGCRFAIGCTNMQLPLREKLTQLGMELRLTRRRGKDAADIYLRYVARAFLSEPETREHLSVVILLSSDCGFIPAVQRWRKYGYEVWAIGPRGAWKRRGFRHLAHYADHALSLDELEADAWKSIA